MMYGVRAHLPGCAARFIRNADCSCEARIRGWGGYMNALLLAVAAVYIAIRAYERYLHPSDVVEGWMIAAAFAGAVLNWTQHEMLHGEGREKERYTRILEIGATIFLLELAVGLWSGSLALEADAWHVLSDNGAVIVSLVVISLLPERLDRDHVTHHSLDAHIIGDFLQSIAVIGAGAWMYYTGDHIVDPVLSGVIALVLLLWAMKIARDSHRGTFGLDVH